MTARRIAATLPSCRSCCAPITKRPPNKGGLSECQATKAGAEQVPRSRSVRSWPPDMGEGPCMNKFRPDQSVAPLMQVKEVELTRAKRRAADASGEPVGRACRQPSVGVKEGRRGASLGVGGYLCVAVRRAKVLCCLPAYQQTERPGQHRGQPGKLGGN